MKISAHNLGPIRDAVVELHPLTIFIGPNNSGKSLLATVIYACMSRIPGRMRIFRSDLEESLSDEAIAEIQAFVSNIAQEDTVPAAELVPETYRQLAEDRIKLALDRLCAIIQSELKRATGVPLTELRRIQQIATRASLTIESEAPYWKIIIRITSKGATSEISYPKFVDVWNRVKARNIRNFAYRASGPGGAVPKSLYFSDVTNAVSTACFDDLPSHTKYLPAARSGLMHSHKVLAGTLIRNSSFAGLEDMIIPAMSGVVTDFLGEMVELENRQSNRRFSQIASRLERDLLKGKIRLDNIGSGYPEIMYETSSAKFSLTRTSSMVSELASVVLYLRRILNYGDLLMMEEPEAHLHPRVQVLFAETLARLINNNLSLLITTHSEFFMQQISNFILAGSLQMRGVESPQVDSELKLDYSKVQVYGFKPAENGTTVAPIATDSREGVQVEEFNNVAEFLYNQNVDLDRRLDNGS